MRQQLTSQSVHFKTISCNPQLLLFFMGIVCLFPQYVRSEDPKLNIPAIDKAVLDQMQKQKIVGMAVGVIREGKVVFTKGYGFSNLERKTPVTQSTIFNWASNSKPVMAILALQLVELGKLDLDASVRTYLPDLPMSMQAITPRYLLCHQSGIPHYSNGKIISTGQKVLPKREQDPKVALNRFVRSPLIFPSGSKMAYSSYAYVLLSAVVQAAGGEKLQAQLQARIQKPLMLQSFQPDLPYAGQANWTMAYTIGKAGTPIAVKEYAHFWKHGAGAYKSNIEDFAKFAVALMNHQLIAEKTSEMMWVSQKTSDGNATAVGLGVFVTGTGRFLKVSHNGKQDETRTRMVIYPRLRHGMVVMCNTAQADPGIISTAIYRAMTTQK